MSRRYVTAPKSKVKALACPVPRPKMRRIDRNLLERAERLLQVLQEKYGINLDFPETATKELLNEISATLKAAKP